MFQYAWLILNLTVHPGSGQHRRMSDSEYICGYATQQQTSREDEIHADQKIEINETSHWPTGTADTIRARAAGSANLPVVQSAAQWLFLAAHERAQPAANDLDVPEGPAPKFYLSLQDTNVP
jgi:hypothetical protein